MEMEGILRHIDARVRLVQPADLGFSFDVDESAGTFSGNSAIKAWGLHGLLKGDTGPGVACSVDPRRVPDLVRDRLEGETPLVVADDSGICVHALDNRPGVLSARFGSEDGGPDLGDEGRNDLLLETLTGVDDRGAHYVCNMTLIVDRERWVQVEDTWHGVILSERHPGSTGFGYDPIVWLPDYDCSVAQLPQEQKDRISHRAKAARGVLAAAGVV